MAAWKQCRVIDVRLTSAVFLTLSLATHSYGVGEPPLNSLLCRRLLAATGGDVRAALAAVDAEIHGRLGQVRVNLDQESREVIENAESLARYLESAGSDAVEAKILADARRAGIVVEISGASSTDTNSNRVWIDRTYLRDHFGGVHPELHRVVRHELSHKLYHSRFYLNTDVPEFVFLRELDANLYAGYSFEGAVFVTLRNYAGFFGPRLDRYRDPQFPRDPMRLTRNLLDAVPTQARDFAMISQHR